ncbi:MAG TPA: hypothetical protein VL475_15270, partial [Planctomycetaceae bacterium]|nr:hypothetical protein [Planctomycetaceae bacterium]
MSSVSPIALSNTIGISGAAPTNGGIGNGDIAAPVPDSKRRRGRGLTWRPLAGAAAIVALSLPFAANDVSPSGFEARVIRTAAADATQTLRQQASALAQQGIVTGQSQLLEGAVRAFEKSLAGPGVDDVTKA